MRAYFVDDMPAAQVADRFGYSTASVHQMATLLRGGRMEFFAAAKPGPKGPRKAGQVHDRVLALRADGHSVTEIAAALHAEGTPVSAQTVWTILDAEGIGRLVRDDTGRRGTPARLDPVKATTLSPSSWPAGTHLPCDHAGLFLLLPAIVSLGLTDLPKANHLRTYAYRVRRDSNRTLLSGLVNALRRQGLATGEAGFNCDFHAIRHHGEVVPPKVLSELAALPASAWTTHRIDRAGHYRHPQIHDQVLAIKGIDNRVRQIAVRNIGRDEPTLIITNALTTPAKDLFARYAERMTIE